jgi:catechol 2,3-dioxygenase-like lactoylglutathione lyase family enzyme
MEVNGMAHVMLTVSNYEACVAFYEKLLPFLGPTFVVRKTDEQFYLHWRAHRAANSPGRSAPPGRAIRSAANRAASHMFPGPRAAGHRRGSRNAPRN